MCQSFKFNINHIVSKIEELRYQIFNSTKQIHICGVTETFLTESHSDHEIAIPGYNLSRRDRIGKGGGGIVAHVNSHLTHKRVVELEYDKIESLWLQVIADGKRKILICFIYWPPNTFLTHEWLSHFEVQISKATQLSKHVILMSDFNVDLNKFNLHKHKLTLLCDEYNFIQVIDESTRVTEKSSTLIDHVYVTAPDFVLGTSDHFPVCITYGCDQIKNLKNDHTEIIARDFKNFNQANFLTHLEFSLLSSDKNIDVFNNVFLNILDKHAPEIKRRVKQNQLPEWLTPGIKRLMKARDKAKKAMIDSEYKQLRNVVANKITMSKSNFYKNEIRKCNGNSGKLWKVMKAVKNKKQDNHVPKNLEFQGQNLTTDVEITNTFNSYFAHLVDQFITNDGLSQFVPSDKFTFFVRTRLPLEASFSIPCITSHAIKKELSKIDTKKGAGPDKLSPKYLNISADVTCDILCDIINESFRSGRCPEIWKTSRIVPLHKGGSFGDLDNYRPISILCAISKIVERHIYDSLFNFLVSHDLILPNQSGFMKNHSCSTGLTAMLNTWLSDIDQGRIIEIMNIDLRKAFNLVNHEILLTKLSLYGVNNLTINWFRLYLHK